MSRNESNPVKRRKGKEDVTGGKRKGEDTWREVKRRTRHEWLTTGVPAFSTNSRTTPTLSNSPLKSDTVVPASSWKTSVYLLKRSTCF